MKVRTKELRLVDTVQECHIYSLQTTAYNALPEGELPALIARGPRTPELESVIAP